jgi:TetR/AcrR family transcriptional regulator, transcriptional repressor for nem operon
LAINLTYFVQLRGMIATTLHDNSRWLLERLHAYFDATIALFAGGEWRYGCLAGNMGLEAEEHSELIPARLSEIFAEWTPPFADVIRQAQASGEASDDLDADDVGSALLEA